MIHKKKCASAASLSMCAALITWALPAFAQGPDWTVNSTVVKIVDTISEVELGGR